jgi:hypothetical protein
MLMAEGHQHLSGQHFSLSAGELFVPVIGGGSV